MAGKKRRGLGVVEDKLIRRIRDTSPLSGGPMALTLGIGDDAALFMPRAGHQTILTCDWFLEGTHFLRDGHPANAVGWKSLARALSDVAAMGGQPRCFLLGLALPPTHTGRWLDEFLRGLRRAALRFRCPLAGGDTTRREQILINVTVVGEVRKGQAVLRSGAHSGDVVCVTGRLGEAELGLWRLRGRRKVNIKVNIKDPAVRKHLYPEPRIGLGCWLAARRIATAMMDLSDGLSSDLPRLCAASRVGARVFAAKLPTASTSSRARQRDAAPVSLTDLALNGGDDYELLFTVHPGKAHSLPHSFHGISLTKVGEITRERSLKLIRPDGREEPLEARGWDPFGK
jgi:thiamine-monophosphate kinase